VTSVFWKENKPLDTNAKPNVLATHSSQIELENYFSQSKDQDFQKIFLLNTISFKILSHQKI
jgi:hypothetical protein